MPALPMKMPKLPMKGVKVPKVGGGDSKEEKEGLLDGEDESDEDGEDEDGEEEEAPPKPGCCAEGGCCWVCMRRATCRSAKIGPGFYDDEVVRPPPAIPSPAAPSHAVPRRPPCCSARARTGRLAGECLHAADCSTALVVFVPPPPPPPPGGGGGD